MRIDFTPIRQMNPLLALGGVAALGNMIGKFIGGAKQTKESKKINPIWQQYQRSPFASQQLSLAKQMMGDPSLGTRGQVERGIQTNNANFMGNVNRNATDSSQALALGAAGLGQANQSIIDANTGFAQNKLALTQNLNQAYDTNIEEGDKEYQSMLQKYGMDVQRKDDLRNAGAQNKYSAVSDLASMAFTAGTSGLFGGGGRNPSGGLRQFGGSGMSPIPYGASVYNKLTTPRTPLTNNRNVIIGG